MPDQRAGKGQRPMILEAALLDLRAADPATAAAFEDAFRRASPLIASTPGYLGHMLQRRTDAPGRYLLLVEWETVEAHTVGFRRSAAYQEWRALLHHFYDPFPVVEHFEAVDLGREAGSGKAGSGKAGNDEADPPVPGGVGTDGPAPGTPGQFSSDG
jgi:heme-degrading monooxygenase HmoA